MVDENGEVGELNEQIIPVIESETLGIAPDFLEIFKAQVKITAGGQDQAAFKPGLQLIAALTHELGNKRKGLIGVGGADDVGNSVGDGHFGHLASDVE